MILPCRLRSLAMIEHIMRNEMLQSDAMTHDSDCILLVDMDVDEQLRAVDGISNHLFLESLLVLFGVPHLVALIL
jgi:hypothetical protein